MSKLKRYTMSTFYNEYVSEESPDGEWVKFEDLPPKEQDDKHSEHMEFLSATGGLDSEEQDDEEDINHFSTGQPIGDTTTGPLPPPKGLKRKAGKPPVNGWEVSK